VLNDNTSEPKKKKTFEEETKFNFSSGGAKGVVED
jgi:hypothetical protein